MFPEINYSSDDPEEEFLEISENSSNPQPEPEIERTSILTPYINFCQNRYIDHSSIYNSIHTRNNYYIFCLLSFILFSIFYMFYASSDQLHQVPRIFTIVNILSLIATICSLVDLNRRISHFSPSQDILRSYFLSRALLFNVMTTGLILAGVTYLNEYLDESEPEVPIMNNFGFDIFLAEFFFAILLSLRWFIFLFLAGLEYLGCRCISNLFPSVSPTLPVYQQSIPHTKILTYDELPEENKNETCSICLENFVDGVSYRQLNYCQHIYHQSCIDKWLLERNQHCPLCRSSLQESTPISNPETVNLEIDS